MKFFVAVLLGFCALSVRADSSEERETLISKEVKPVLQKLVKLIDENNLNVVIIGSEQHYWSNGKIKESDGFALHYPKNEAPKNSLTKEIASDFVKLASEAKLVALTRRITIENGNVADVKKINNNEGLNNGMPVTNVYKWLTQVTNGKVGFVFDKKDYAIMTNFIVQGADGKNETTTIVVDNIIVKVLEKSPGITEEEVTVIKNILPKVEMVFNSDTDAATSLVNYLDIKLSQNDWQVIVNPKEFYVASTKYVLLKALETEYLVFALKK